MELKKTSRWGKGRAAHHHIAFISDVTTDPQSQQQVGWGTTSVWGKAKAMHSHAIRWVPEQVEQAEQPPQVDPMTGQMLSPGMPAQPGIPAHWELEPDPIDGHAHELEDYVVQDITPEETDEEVVTDVINLGKEWKLQEDTSFKQAEEAEGFYWGDEQWEETDRQRLEGLNRACLTVNYISRHIDELTGQQRQQRTDLKYRPVEGSDQTTSDIANHLTKHILEATYYPREESKGFEDASIAGRGWLNLYMDFSKNIQGDIRVERFPWKDVIVGPHEKEDLEDCEGLIKHRWYSKAKIQQMFPDKAKSIEANWDGYYDKTNHSVDPGPGKYYHVGSARYPYTLGGMPLVDLARKEYRLLECWRKVYERVSVVAIPSQGFYFNCFGWDESDIKAIEALPIDDVQVIRKLEARMRITKICGGVVLQDEYPAELPADDFFLIPIYAKKRGDKFKGKVADAIDPQREVNHRRSQLVDIGNKMISYGYFIDPNTFVDKDEEEKFRKSSSKPGFVSKVNNTDRIPVQTQGVKFPSESAQLLQIAQADVAEALNVSVDPTGANESAQHFMGLIQQKMRGNEYLFENLSFAKKKLGKLLLAMIQKYYTPERIARIIMNQQDRQGKPVQVGEQPVTEYTEEQIVEFLRNADLTQNDVEVSEDAYSQSYRLAIFMMLKEMMQAGAPVSPEMLIEFAPIPEEQKKRAYMVMEQQASAAQEAENSKQKAEIQKTLIAQGYIPPEVQAQMQQQQPGQPMPPAQQGAPNINQGVAGA